MIKRFFDILFSIIGLLLLIPFLILIVFFIKKRISNKIFFIQKRAGYHCKPIYLIKFRTMNENKDNQGNLLPEEERIGSCAIVHDDSIFSAAPVDRRLLRLPRSARSRWCGQRRI